MLQQTNAFARAKLMMAQIAAAMAFTSAIQRQAALAQIGSYESHGKGSGKTSPSRRCVAMDKRAARKARGVKRHKAAMRRA
ncbi:hypothetical protein B0G74_7881 [Paraburkholderia sp. BL9I2N2]|nr:hypothetical protein B0G74_7881 [Paraburkholderia sp. BL9I2N2]